MYVCKLNHLGQVNKAFPNGKDTLTFNFMLLSKNCLWTSFCVVVSNRWLICLTIVRVLFPYKNIRQPSKNLWTKVERLKSVEWFIVCCYRCRSLSFFESIELLSSPCWRFFQFLILIIIIITILSCTHFTDLRKTVHHSASSLAQPRPSLRWRWQLHLFSFAIWLTALS